MGYGSLDMPSKKIQIKDGEIIIESGFEKEKELLKRCMSIPELFIKPHTVTAEQIRVMLADKITELRNAVESNIEQNK